MAERLNAAAQGKIYSGKDYLRLAKSESEAVQLFQTLLANAVHGENVIYVTTEREHLALLPDGAVRGLTGRHGYANIHYISEIKNLEAVS